MKDNLGHGSTGRAGGFFPHTVPTNPQPGEIPPGCHIIFDRGQYRRTVPGTGQACMIADADAPGLGAGGDGTGKTLAEVSAEGATQQKSAAAIRGDKS